MVDILWNERNVATRMVKWGCIVKRAPSIKKKKQEGISFEKSLLSVATGEHCLVCSIYYTYIYIYIYYEIDSESRPWKNAKQETSVLRVDASRCLAPANLAFFFLPFFFTTSPIPSKVSQKFVLCDTLIRNTEILRLARIQCRKRRC